MQQVQERVGEGRAGNNLGIQASAGKQGIAPSPGQTTGASGTPAAANGAGGGPAQNIVQASSQTKEKAESAKAYIEGKYAKAKYEEKERKDAWDKLKHQMNQMRLSDQEKELIKQEILHKESENYRLQRTKISVKDFVPRKIIGRGAFGEVRVCRNRKTNEVVAIKKMKKQEMIYKNQVAHVRAERDILALASNPWIVELQCSFQDENFLYLVMEYLQGGDLMTLLMEKDILTEEMSRFYIAETILAIESVHNLNYIHRDLKPDNLIIGIDGHIKLSDFGLCKHVEIKAKSANINEQMRSDLSNVAKESAARNPNLSRNQANRRAEYIRNRQLAFSTVGTPDYIAPEVFGQKGYNETVDWWSCGAILFEMLVGYPPFFSDEPSITCQKILAWRKTLTIPEEAKLSGPATDILKRLLCDAENRLGANGINEIKSHPFFAGLDWANLRKQKAPFSPTIKNDEDASRFDKFDEESPFYPDPESAAQAKGASGKAKKRKDINFPGYTYKREVEDQKTKLVQALKGLLNSEDVDRDGDNVSPPEQEQRIPKQQVRSSAPPHPHQNLQLSQQQLYAQAQTKLTQQHIVRQQTIEQKNKQIAVNNTSAAASIGSQRAPNQFSQQQYYNNGQMGQGASQPVGQSRVQTIQSSNMQTSASGSQNPSAMKVTKQVAPPGQKLFDDSKQRMSVMNQMLTNQGGLVTGAPGSSAQGAKKGFSRNNQNLGAGGGTAGPLLQGGQKQQMNFTTYESGFGARSNGQGAGVAGPSGMLGKSQRGTHEFGTNANATQGSNSRNVQGGLISSNSLMKPQHIGVYNNMGGQSVQKQAAASSQGKFLSKSPNPQNKMMAGTNYGKFKGVQHGAMPVNSVYSRNQGGGGQYLPKLGGGNNIIGASSQAQLPHNQNLQYQQSHMLQQNSSSQLAHHGIGQPGVTHTNSYQQLQRSKQSIPSQHPNVGPHTSSQQNIKIMMGANGTPGNNSQMGIKSSNAMNFRQNLNISLQQIANKGGSSSKSTSQGPNSKQGTSTNNNAYRNLNAGQQIKKQ